MSGLPGVKDYPRQWIVGEDIWTLKFVRKIEGNPVILGLCDPGDLTIYIKLKQSKFEMLMSTLHELFHCAEFSHNIDFRGKPIYTYRTFHNYIYKMEKAMGLLFVQNADNFLKLFGTMK